MNYARWEGAILAVNGKLYIFGGLANSMHSFNPLPKIMCFRFEEGKAREEIYKPSKFVYMYEEYDPNENKWEVQRRLE